MVPVLSVQQPFATLLLHPVRKPRGKQPAVPMKWVENRTWAPPDNLPYGVDGYPRILIHTGVNGSDDDPDFTGRRDRAGLLELAAVRSAILGSIRLIGVVRNTGTAAEVDGRIDDVLRHAGYRSWPQHGHDHFSSEKDIYYWIVDQPVRFETPILNVKGKLHLWQFDLPPEYQASFDPSSTS